MLPADNAVPSHCPESTIQYNTKSVKHHVAVASEAQFVNYAVYTSIQHLLRVPSTNQQVNWKYIDNVNIKTNVNHPFLLLMAKI